MLTLQNHTKQNQSTFLRSMISSP